MRSGSAPGWCWLCEESLNDTEGENAGDHELISVSVGCGDSDEDIVLRIKADAAVLRPDEPVPARPVL